MVIKRNVYYFADLFWENTFGSQREEFDQTVATIAAKYGITFENVKCVDTPPFGESYSILFFDWGGMSLGNSLMEHFCKYIIKEAIDRPSVDYVMTSRLTKNAMEDAKSQIPNDIPNIYLSVEDWCDEVAN